MTLEDINYSKDTFIRTKTVANMLNVCVSTVYNLLKSDSTFPKPLSLTPSKKIIVFSKNDIHAWIESVKKREQS